MFFVLALGAVMAATPPQGWVRIPEPSEALLECANASPHEWRVSPHEGGVRLEPDVPPGGGARQTLPFKPSRKLFPMGWSHSLAVKDGYFVGSNGGEWGGALFWFSTHGRKHRQLAKENVRGLIASGPDEVLSLHGLNHLGGRRGSVRWFKQGTDKQWSLSEEKPLDAGPYAYTVAGEAVYVVTATSLTKIGPGRQVKLLEPLPTWMLYPNSLVVDASGALWVGMRHFVLRLTPEGEKFTREWFLPKDCLQAGQGGHDCVCQP
ncbi:hypothetical protein [Archangium sp.]|jgi:hypothetical protein|uniref:hypothetical protein n=1 Tax=Archangium sp. TaxID=1872627 RepID=UPI002ED8D80E